MECVSFSPSSLLGGGYLLSHFRSTIGVTRLNFSVRNGKRWDPRAITTFVFSFSLGDCAPLGVILLGDNGRELEPCVCDFATVITAVKLLSLFGRVSVCVHSENRGEVAERLSAPHSFVCFSLSLCLSLLGGGRGRGRRGLFRAPSCLICFVLSFWHCCQESFRAISRARLRTLPPLHLPPINVVVYNGPHARSYLVASFALRCFQRLSWPDADTRRCTWRYNR